MAANNRISRFASPYSILKERNWGCSGLKRKMKLQTPGEKPMKTAISRVLELPESTLTGGLHIEMNSNHEAVVENCRGVLEYTPQVIRLIAGGMVVKFTGRGLAIGSLNRNVTVVSGIITAVEFLF